MAEHTDPRREPPAGLDLTRRLSDGSAALEIALIRWVHACADVTAERYIWMRDYRHCSDDSATATADYWRRAVVRCAHEAHEVARQLDVRDKQRAEQHRLMIEDAIEDAHRQRTLEEDLYDTTDTSI